MSDTDEASKRRYLAEVDKVLLYLRTLFGPWTDEVDPNVMITGEGGRAASAASSASVPASAAKDRPSRLWTKSCPRKLSADNLATGTGRTPTAAPP